ncbi:MAG: hypothetical protein J6584_07555 [Lactobacillus sp.]|uniref:hypothetical protein n=1 Tax=Bombilactobacillus bombi TaxID=1303590 RepID=UPI0035E8B0B2|nr:hypothetical protein [Lactobacillus sp.]
MKKKIFAIGTTIIVVVLIVGILIRLMFNHPYNSFQKNVEVNKSIKELVINTGGTDVNLNIEPGDTPQITTNGYAPIKNTKEIVLTSKNIISMNFDTEKKNLGVILSKKRPIVNVNVSSKQLQNLDKLKIKTNGGNIKINNSTHSKISYYAFLNGGNFKNKSRDMYVKGSKLGLYSNGGEVILK